MLEFEYLTEFPSGNPDPCNAHVHLDVMPAIFMVIDILINNHTPRSIQFNKFVPVIWTIESVMRGSVHQSTIRVIRHEISRNIAPGVIFRCHRTCHICSITGSSGGHFLIRLPQKYNLSSGRFYSSVYFFLFFYLSCDRRVIESLEKACQSRAFCRRYCSQTFEIPPKNSNVS